VNNPCEGLKPDLSVDMEDPQNARYLKALDREEDTARSMADAICGAKLEQIDGELTTEQDEALYNQCLVDSRRMLCDPDYAALFGG
jgi:hypothetical protein